MTELKIVGASAFTRRGYEACGPFQWVREILKNSQEAGATRLHYGIEWEAVTKRAVYRRIAIDDGVGMSRDELYEYFSTLGATSKTGGTHGNFGIGAKISLLPWNPEGLTVISRQGDDLWMVQIVCNPDSGNFELVDFDDDDRSTNVIDPRLFEWDEVDWAKVWDVAVDGTGWLKRDGKEPVTSGLLLVMHGSDANPDTVLGNPEAAESNVKGITKYLNTRMWNLGKLKVSVDELRTGNKVSWPQGRDDRDDKRRPNRRTVEGAEHWLTYDPGGAGRLADHGTVELEDGRVRAHYYLWEGERPKIHAHAAKNGYIAIRYQGELYKLTQHKAHWRWFGILQNEVQTNLTIILEPNKYEETNGKWGVHPDQGRNRLLFSGGGELGADLPLADWGAEFAENLPPSVLEVVLRASREQGRTRDSKYLERLANKFGDRWKRKVVVAALPGETPTTSGAETDEEVDAEKTPKKRTPSTPSIVRPVAPRGPKRVRSTRKRVKRKKLDGQGNVPGVEVEAVVDIPDWELAPADDFEKEWHLAMYAAVTPSGRPCVRLNKDAEVFREVIQHHQSGYPAHLADEVEGIVFDVFGEVAVCKVAHTERMAKLVTDEELERSYRSEEALTLALMGLIAEESLIAQRLGRLGRKRAG